LKVSLLLILNRMFRHCRMYEKRPAEPGDNCYVCAARGGYFLCRRSKELGK
jgi:hypothetical protein